MEIAFRTKTLRGVCLNGDAMDERYGPERAALLRRCLADLRAAATLGEVPLLAREAGGDTFGSEVSLGLGKGVRISVRAGHKKPPRLPGGAIDWSRVERVLIERVDLRDE